MLLNHLSERVNRFGRAWTNVFLSIDVVLILQPSPFCYRTVYLEMCDLIRRLSRNRNKNILKRGSEETV